MLFREVPPEMNEAIAMLCWSKVHSTSRLAEVYVSIFYKIWGRIQLMK